MQKKNPLTCIEFNVMLWAKDVDVRIKLVTTYSDHVFSSLGRQLCILGFPKGIMSAL